MKEYIVRINDDGSIVDIEELDEDPCGQCRDVEELEAIMVAMVKSLNERLTLVEQKIKELEARPSMVPVPCNYPYIAPPDPFPGNWTITCKH